MNVLKVISSLLLVLGIVLAIQPAEEWNVGAIGKYAQGSAANVTTEGGNVTELNLTSNISTEKWAGFWGNVSGKIVLSPGTSMFYTWSWDSSKGGEVCAIAASSGFNWTGLQTITAGIIDSLWGFATGDTDSATNTFTQSCSVDVAGKSITGSAGVTHTNFQTCAVGDGDNAAKSDVAFCVNISQGTTLFNGLTGDYELLVPTNETAGATETHYFWLELD